VLVVEPEAPTNDARLDGREGGEKATHLVAPLAIRQVIERRKRILLLQEVDELPPILVTDGAIERKRGLRVEVLHLIQLLARNARLLLELFDRGLVPRAGDDRLGRAGDAVVRVQHVHRNANSAPLVRERAADRM